MNEHGVPTLKDLDVANTRVRDVRMNAGALTHILVKDVADYIAVDISGTLGCVCAPISGSYLAVN